MGKSLMRVVLSSMLVIGALLVVAFVPASRLAGADGSAESEDEPAAEINPLGANAACYVCHIPFVKEELGKVHLKAKVTCHKCHGLSAGHANDEDIGATKPDVVFTRKQVDAMCRKCHDGHNVSARQVVARFISRDLSPKTPVICTDCHGAHKIEPPEGL